MTSLRKKIKTLSVSVALLALGMATCASAANYTLTASEFTKKVGNESIYFWGFNGTVPGPVLRVPPGDTSLTVVLKNTLKVPVSLIIPGLTTPLASVKIIDGQGRERITSFDKQAEAKSGATTTQVTYTWNNIRPGTYMYHSGTDPEVQVQMGLYGAMTAVATPKTAINGQTYDNEAIMIYGELDKALHNTVMQFSTAGGPYPTIYKYKRDASLVNGNAYPNATPIMEHLPIAGEKILLRLLNSANNNVMPTLQQGYMSIIGEDAFPYPYAKQQYGVEVTTGRTKDAFLFVAPASGALAKNTAGTVGTVPLDIPIYDGALPGGDGTTGGENIVRVNSQSEVKADPTANGGSADGGGWCFIKSLFGDME